MRRKKINLKGIVCALMSSAMILTLVTPASAATARATTMKLEKTEGTVTLKTQNGSERKITTGMRLYNGNALETAKYSYAHISLDSTKAVKLDQSSSATLRQSGKQLELLVKSGKLFFNVNKKLDSNESMNVRTSTMVTGIRGTCGVVEYVDVNKSKLYLIEGQVTLGSGDNVTTVYGGQTATVVLQPKQETGGSGQPGSEDKPGESGETDKEMEQKVMVEPLTEKQIPPVALQEIVADPVLQEKIEQNTELKIEKIEEALEQFEKEEAERIEQEKEEGTDTDKDTEKENEDKETESSTTGSGGSSSSPGSGSSGGSTITETTLSGTVTPGAIQAAFQDYQRVHIGTNATMQFSENDTLTIPGGKMLHIWGKQEIPTTTTITVGDGTTQGLLCVVESASFAAGTINVTANSRLEDHGTLSCTNLTGGANTTLINNYFLSVDGTLKLSSGSIYENHGQLTCGDLTSEGGAQIKNTSFMNLSGKAGLTSEDTYSAQEDALMVSTGGSDALVSKNYLLATAKYSSGNTQYCYYAHNMCQTIVETMQELIKSETSETITWEFAKNAEIPSGVNGTLSNFNANMNEYALQVKGILSLSGDASITGTGNATIQLMSGGKLVLESEESDIASGTIENSETGCAITSDGGTLEWNATGYSIGGESAGKAIDQATGSGENSVAVLPEWVRVKEGYAPVWSDKAIRLQAVSAEYNSGTLTAADLNMALSANKEVTIGEDVEISLGANETVTVPATKILNIKSKMISGGTEESPSYSFNFKWETGSKISLCDGAKIYLSGYMHGAGTIDTADGQNATVEVDSGATLEADQVILYADCNLTNYGTVDVGTISTDGTETITNHALIKTKSYEHATQESIKGKYIGEKGSVLVNNSDLSGLLGDVSLLAYANTSETETNGLQYFYSDSLGGIMEDRINNIKSTSGVDALKEATTVWWHFVKSATVPAGIEITLSDFNADMGTNEIKVAGKMTLAGTTSINGTISVESGATLVVQASSIPNGSTLKNNGGTIYVNGELYEEASE